MGPRAASMAFRAATMPLRGASLPCGAGSMGHREALMRFAGASGGWRRAAFAPGRGIDGAPGSIHPAPMSIHAPRRGVAGSPKPIHPARRAIAAARGAVSAVASGLPGQRRTAVSRQPGKFATRGRAVQWRHRGRAGFALVADPLHVTPRSSGGIEDTIVGGDPSGARFAGVQLPAQAFGQTRVPRPSFCRALGDAR